GVRDDTVLHLALDRVLRLVRARDFLAEDGSPDRHPWIAVHTRHLATVDLLHDEVQRKLAPVLLGEERQGGRARAHEARGNPVSLRLRSMAGAAVAKVELPPGRLLLGGSRDRRRAEHQEHERPEDEANGRPVSHGYLLGWASSLGHS